MCQTVYLILRLKNHFKKINNDDLNKNFLGVYPSDKMNLFIKFEKMMPGKKISFLDFKQG